MKFDIKTIEAITNTAEMKAVMIELAQALADVDAKARPVMSKADAEAERKAERKAVVRDFLNSAQAKSALSDFKSASYLTTQQHSQTIVQEMALDVIKHAVKNSNFLGLLGHQTVSSVDFHQLVLAGRPSVHMTGEQVVHDAPNIGNTDVQSYTEVAALFSKIFAMPIMTHEILRDSHIDIEADLMELIAEEWTWKLIDMYLFGHGKKVGGIQDLRGILHHRIRKSDGYDYALSTYVNPDYFRVLPTGHVDAFGTNATEIEDYFIDLQAALPSKYQADAKWVMALSTFIGLKKLRTEQGFPIIEFGKFSQSGNAHTEGYGMLGKPIVIVDQMPELTNASYKTPVIYGDLKQAYKMVPLAGSEHFIVDDITKKGARQIYMDQRIGEIIGKSDAIMIALTGVHARHQFTADQVDEGALETTARKRKAA